MIDPPEKEFAHCVKDLVEEIAELKERTMLLEQELFKHFREAHDDRTRSDSARV